MAIKMIKPIKMKILDIKVQNADNKGTVCFYHTNISTI